MAATRKKALVLAWVLALVLAWVHRVRSVRRNVLAVLLAPPLATWLQYAQVQHAEVRHGPVKPQAEVRWGLLPWYTHTVSLRQALGPKWQFD